MASLSRKSLSRFFIFLGITQFLFSCAYFGKERKTGKSERESHIEKYKALEEKYNELLSQSSPDTPHSQREDIHANYKKIMGKKVNRTLDGSSYDRGKVARELRSLSRLQLKIKKQRYGDAVLLAKELEKSNVEQIRAQARFLLAEVMQAQGESLIAVQIYEEVAISMPFSIFSKKAIDRGSEVSKLIGDPVIVKRFKEMKTPFEEAQGSFN